LHADPFFAAAAMQQQMFGRPAPNPSTLAFYPQGQFAHIPMFPTAQFVDSTCHLCGANHRTKVLLPCYHSSCEDCFGKLSAMGN
jgi:hypothetical protein